MSPMLPFPTYSSLLLLLTGPPGEQRHFSASILDFEIWSEIMETVIGMGRTVRVDTMGVMVLVRFTDPNEVWGT